MLKFYEVQIELRGFLFKHFSYKDLLRLIGSGRFKHKIHYFENIALGRIPSVGSYLDKDNFAIAINEKIKNPNARWYYLGHELGHYFLHSEAHALYRFDLRRKVRIKQKVRFQKVTEAEASIFSKLTFIPLEHVRKLLVKYNKGEIFGANDEKVIKELVEFSLEKFMDPKPKRIGLESKIASLLDSYKIILAWQNILEVNSKPMEIFTDSNTNEMFKCPRRVFR